MNHKGSGYYIRGFRSRAKGCAHEKTASRARQRGGVGARWELLPAVGQFAYMSSRLPIATDVQQRAILVTRHKPTQL
nr:hypothetical protein CFP56_03958 [Quercus suber]